MVFGCLFVCLYPINVQMSEPVGPEINCKSVKNVIIV